ncbi:PWWP domain-containing DNA repair factor 3A [Cheilinus undulatus]|uniref:PWWP domain-containing DNA repair factor 3A n=1 Tax=Cheilinus undulatus TaxID=241271 RepID=UPI001BD636DB|nr:PWWP domain-containing DNA repair factor 3A [Cheilinus undulatus]
MKGGSRKMRKGKPKRTPTKEVTTSTVLPEDTNKSKAVPGNAFASSALPETPKRSRGQTRQTPEACLTSTPVHSSSTDISKFPTAAQQLELECTPLKTPEANSPCLKSRSQSRLRENKTSQPVKVRKRVSKEQTCSDAKGAPAKRQRGRTGKTKAGTLQKDITSKPSERSRPRFELEISNGAEEEKDEALLSSDLSIELSHHEHQLLSLSIQEDVESDEMEEEELPSFLMQGDKKPPAITEGAFVWYKLRNYPFWPALVKSVNRKQKKASILFIDNPKIYERKGFTVPLKTLKPFDCGEAEDLVCKAKENYNAALEWSLQLITDYRIRLACCSFSGSFIEYCAHDMSYPVRRKYPQDASERFTIASDSMLEALVDKEDSFSEQQEEVSRISKRLLPDRSLAAHNRANEKLVHFIVKQRMVEARLLAVVHGQQESRWLHSFLHANQRRRVVKVYLEDDQQLDSVYKYLNELYATALSTQPRLAELNSMERIPFVMDVLLPEAIIYAIAGVENVSVEKAEEKYLKGRCISKRERQEFDLRIERQMESQNQNTLPVLASNATG